MSGDFEQPSTEEMMKSDYVLPHHKGLEYTDIVKIAFYKNSWRISEITRHEK
jgi:hypothetical protein